MKISVICFSLTGEQTAKRLAQGLKKNGREVLLAKKSRYLEDSIREDLKTWTGRQFLEADGIIFVGACGIAVRSIAPFIQGKKTDPAVLSADECGRFVISLLSGHLGGANELAEEAAGILGAIPVVTTATDLHERFAVDVFAKKNRCAILHMQAAKEVSAAVLAGKPAGFYSDYPWEGTLPKGLVPCDALGKPCTGGESLELGIAVSIYKDRKPFPSTVSVVPPAAVIGMGCKKGTSKDDLKQAAEGCRERLGIYPQALGGIASISLKKEEPGLLALSEEWGIPFSTFTEQELLAVPGNFTGSEFVMHITGVDNVCERSALLLAKGGRLIEKKVCGSGVTTAVAEKKWRISFE